MSTDKHQLRYRIVEIDDAASVTFCESTWNPLTQPAYAIEDCAQDHFDNHDGWESSWPLTFILLDENNIEYARAMVEREDKPEFFARDTTPPLVTEDDRF